MSAIPEHINNDDFWASVEGQQVTGIQKVCDNLKRTIANKQNYLLAIQNERTFVGLRDGEELALSTTVKFLEININELKAILADVEKCL